MRFGVDDAVSNMKMERLLIRKSKQNSEIWTDSNLRRSLQAYK